MSDSSKIDQLNKFIEATTSAAARFRRVLIVVIVASTLAFGAFWNSRAGSWLNSRIRLAQNAATVLSLEETSKKLVEVDKALSRTDQKISQSDVGKEEKRKAEELRTSLLDTKEELLKDEKTVEQSISKSDLETAQTWLEKRGFRTSAQLKTYSDRLDQARVDYIVLIRIPFFGIVLDVNDLGALGGFTFVVILLWFRFSLWREYYNLSLTFKEAANDEELKYCYKALSMSQVLTVPPALSEHQPRERPWGKVVRILYFLPLAVQLIIFIYDCLSFNYGWYTSPFNTVFGFSLSLCFLFLSGLLTYWCFRLSSEIDQEWDEAAGRILKTA